MYRWHNDDFEFEGLVGKTFTRIDKKGSDELVFYDTDGEIYVMYHEQDCCESVYIEDIDGDLEDLLHSPILMAEEVRQAGKDSDWGTSTWTFYKIATIKGTVTLRWLGESNGYYSESVDFVRVTNEDDKRSYQDEPEEKEEEKPKEVYFMINGQVLAKAQPISTGYSNLKSLD
ncbi:hypothetical protein LD11_gp124 [Bacillus phage Riley]|nr:hypothetical protein LD11_gp124 [Bacillus phage Riley]AIF72000.1 hypothetical protein [Bacillus phage Riley]ASZ75858.1 hypothetical protein TAFFO16_125 [Bacillus phage Taffo16]ULF48749.1 hypothetical protein [Bacillus phage BillyBob]